MVGDQHSNQPPGLVDPDAQNSIEHAGRRDGTSAATCATALPGSVYRLHEQRGKSGRPAEATTSADHDREQLPGPDVQPPGRGPTPAARVRAGRAAGRTEHLHGHRPDAARGLPPVTARIGELAGLAGTPSPRPGGVVAVVARDDEDPRLARSRSTWFAERGDQFRMQPVHDLVAAPLRAADAADPLLVGMLITGRTAAGELRSTADPAATALNDR